MAIVVANLDVGKTICNALGVDSDMVRRIIIDINIEYPVVAYVEMYGSEKILDINWDMLKGATVNVLDKEGL